MAIILIFVFVYIFNNLVFVIYNYINKSTPSLAISQFGNWF
jgi:hypothetical protein